MSHIGNNIKRIRAVKRLSQAAFADLFGLARPSVGAYEEGRSEPKIDTLIAIAEYFGLSVDALLRQELSIDELYAAFEMLKGFFAPGLGNRAHSEQPSFFSGSSRPAENRGLPFINRAMQLAYIGNLNNRDFLYELPKIMLPEVHARTRAFEHKGIEMLASGGGLKDGDIVTAVPVPPYKPAKLQEGSLYVLVTKREILTRRLKKTEAIELIFEADNPALAPLTLEPDDLLELWEVKGVWSTQLQRPAPLEHRMLLLEDQLRQLLERVEELEKK